MKTIFVYQNCEEGICYFVKDGDYSHLNGIYVNGCLDLEKSGELADIGCPEDEKENPEFLTEFPLHIAKEDDVIVITCGWNP